MYCVHCGSPMGEDDRYCGRCGLPSEKGSERDSWLESWDEVMCVYAPLDVMMRLSSEQDDKADELPEQSVSPCAASVYAPPDVMWRQAQEGDGVDESDWSAAASAKAETSLKGRATMTMPARRIRRTSSARGRRES